MSKKSFSKRNNKEEKAVVPVTEKTADELANKDNDGVVVINMAPRSHRDRYANIRQNTEETSATLDDTTTSILSEEANVVVDDNTKYESVYTVSIDKLKEDINDVQTEFELMKMNYEVLSDKQKKLNDQFDNCVSVNDLSYYLNDIKKKIDIVDHAQSNGIGNLSHTISDEAYERKQSDELITKTTEALSENLRSVSEGFECYKGNHEIEHTEIKSKLSSLQGSIDRMDPELIFNSIGDNRNFTNRVREASKDCIDSLIRVTRMLEITFISIVLAFIFLMVKTSIPDTATVARLIFGFASDICMVFIAMESRYIFKYIGFAAKSLERIKRE